MPLKTYGSARLVGAEAMVRVLREMPKEVSDKVVASAVRAGAAVVRKEAIARAPKRTYGKPKRVKTRKTGVTLRALYGAIVKGGGAVRYPGNLKKSIRALRTRKTEHDVTYLVGPTARGFYGLFLEFGTSRQAKRPWLRPVLRRRRTGRSARSERRSARRSNWRRRSSPAASATPGWGASGAVGDRDNRR